jgi:TonB family protein
MRFLWQGISLSFLLCSLILSTSCWAKTHEPERFVTLNGDQIASILGASREPHTMTSLGRLGAPNVYVNEDIEKLTVNEGPCIYVASLVKPAPASTSEVDLECFDLVDEKESKSIAYTADSAGKAVSSGKLSPIGKYQKGDALFDLAGWNWVLEHVSPKLEQKIAAERAQGTEAALSNVYKVSLRNQQNGPGVTPPVLIRSEDAEFSDSGRKAHISGLAILAIVVDDHGLPQRIRSVLPLGYGMDEEAVKAVQQYRFQPSKLQGKKVPVQITIEVNFHQ